MSSCCDFFAVVFCFSKSANSSFASCLLSSAFLRRFSIVFKSSCDSSTFLSMILEMSETLFVASSTSLATCCMVRSLFIAKSLLSFSISDFTSFANFCVFCSLDFDISKDFSISLAYSMAKYACCDAIFAFTRASLASF